MSEANAERKAETPFAKLCPCCQQPMNAMEVLAGLKAIVGRLPKTADGVTVVPGMKVWPRADLFIEGEEGAVVLLGQRDVALGDEMFDVSWDKVYSSVEAASGVQG